MPPGYHFINRIQGSKWDHLAAFIYPASHPIVCTIKNYFEFQWLKCRQVLLKRLNASETVRHSNLFDKRGKTWARKRLKLCDSTFELRTQITIPVNASSRASPSVKSWNGIKDEDTNRLSWEAAFMRLTNQSNTPSKFTTSITI